MTSKKVKISKRIVLAILKSILSNSFHLYSRWWLTVVTHGGDSRRWLTVVTHSGESRWWLTVVTHGGDSRWWLTRNASNGARIMTCSITVNHIHHYSKASNTRTLTPLWSLTLDLIRTPLSETVNHIEMVSHRRFRVFIY